VKLKSKHKWIGVGILCLISGYLFFGMPFGYDHVVFSTVMLVVFMVTALTGFFGMCEANVFGRVYKWVKTDDL
jgi:hypothetical protein